MLIIFARQKGIVRKVYNAQGWLSSVDSELFSLRIFATKDFAQAMIDFLHKTDFLHQGSNVHYGYTLSTMSLKDFADSFSPI